MVVLRVNVKQTAMCCATKFWERGACTILLVIVMTTKKIGEK
jgi:hypothetical protein